MQWIVINFVLAVFWLFFGGAILIAEYAYHWRIEYRPFGISIGWWIMLLVLYNMVKVLVNWSVLSRQRRQESVESPPLSSLARHKPPRVEQPIDPNFQFTDKPPEPENKGP